MNNNSNTIKLSVVIITHNHEKFIGKAIEGILIQKVNFGYDIIICDDASEDKTQEIIRDYQLKNPAIIKTFFSPQNKGPMVMAGKAYEMASGLYLAWLDGDDYWINGEKLQYQVDFLDGNPSYSGCFHDATIISNCNIASKSNDLRYHHQWKYYSQFNHYTSDFYPWSLLERNLIPTASLVCRKENLQPDVFEKYAEVKLSINWLFHLMIIKDSKFRFINELWSVYNDHAEGISKKVGKEDFKISNIRFLKKLLADDYYVYLRKDIYKALSKEYYQLLDLNKGKKKKLIKLIFDYYLYEFKKLISESFYIFRK